MGALIEPMRHKSWATLRLLKHCRGLDAADLDAAIPGTDGTIRETLHQLVDTDEDYQGMLTGRWPTDPIGKP